MKIKLDENLPESIIAVLATKGHDVDSARLEGLSGKPDLTVWESAQGAGRFLITQDLDFSDMRRFQPGTHAGLLLLRLRHPSRQRLLARVQILLETEAFETWARCFVVTTDRKVRLRRPSGES